MNIPMILKCYKNDKNGKQLLCKGDSIIETDYFCITLESSIKLLDVKKWKVLIYEFPFELEEKYSSGVYTYFLSDESLERYFSNEGFNFKDYSKEINAIKFSKLFINYPFGISEIQLYDSQKEEILLELKINVVSDKLNESEFISLVNYVESKSVGLWSKYSLLKNSALLNEEMDKNDWQIIFFQEFIKKLKEKYLYQFQYDRLKFLKGESEIISYSSDVLVDEDSTIWLTQNLDILAYTHSNDCEKILIQNRLFRPLEILTSVTYESTDVIENRFIHGFINELILFLNAYIQELINQIKSYNLGQNFQEILFFYSQKRKIKLNNDFISSLKNIKKEFIEYIPVSETCIDYIPTNRINSKEHYQFIYEEFVKWFSYDKVKHSNNQTYFKGVTRMDKLFERACLYKLIDVFAGLGYNTEFVKKNNEGVLSKIQFKNEKNGRFHTLFFEIYPNEIITQIRTKNGPLKPDFFIEFDNQKVIIMDAKYKKNRTVRDYDWEKLSLKYLHGLGYKNGSYFSPIGLFALIPTSNNKTEFYQNRKYDIESENPAFPAIGSLIVDFEENTLDLEKYMKKIVELVYK